MALVVFIRGVNVGGSKTFRPSVLAKELADFDVVNVGAAGTFVVRGRISPAKLRTEILRRLPFKAEVMIVKGNDLVALMNSAPFDKVAEKELRPFACVMQKAPTKLPRFPISQPDGDKWEVKLINVVGECALTVWRRQEKGMLYPNEVVERIFGLPTTTRSWNTIAKICSILEEK